MAPVDEDCLRVMRRQQERLPPARTEVVERGRVRDYLLALEEEADDDGETVPELFVLTLGRTRRPHAGTATGGGGVNASDSFEILRPVGIGDRITVTARITDVEKKAGRTRQMYRVTTERTFTRDDGEVVARRISTSLRWEA